MSEMNSLCVNDIVEEISGVLSKHLSSAAQVMNKIQEEKKGLETILLEIPYVKQLKDENEKLVEENKELKELLRNCSKYNNGDSKKNEEKHILAINQLMKTLKKDGKLLITLWAFESDNYSKKKKFNKGHNFIKFDKNERYYYIYDESMLIKMLKNINYIYNYYWERGNWNIIFEK